MSLGCKYYSHRDNLADAPSMSQSEETLENIDIDIDIDILWNPIILSSSAQVGPLTSTKPSKTGSIAGSELVRATKASTGSVYKNSPKPTGVFGTGSSGSAYSAGTATASSGPGYKNGSLWATGRMTPTAQAFPSSFLGRGSARKAARGKMAVLLS